MRIYWHRMSSQEPLLSYAYHTILASVEIEEFSFIGLVSCDYLWLLGQCLCAHHLPYCLTQIKYILIDWIYSIVFGKWTLLSDSTFFIPLMLFSNLFNSHLFTYPLNNYLKSDFMPDVSLGTKFMLNHYCTFSQNGLGTLWNRFFSCSPFMFIYSFIHSHIHSGTDDHLFYLFGSVWYHNVSLLFLHLEVFCF